MALFNRIFIVLLAGVVLVFGGAVLLTAVGLIQPAEAAASGSWFAARLVQFTQLDATTMRWTVGICLGLIVLAIVLVVLELRRGGRSPGQITLKDDELGRVTVAVDGLRELTEREAVQIKGVVRVRSHVEQEPPGLRISCRASVDAATSVPELTEELRERLKKSLEHHVGLAVTRVSIETHVAPRQTKRRPRRVE